jgi:hypothetical protein
MNQSGLRRPWAVGGRFLQGIAEGAMADTSAGPSRNVLNIDEKYLWAQRQAHADFAMAWDAWLARAIPHTARTFVAGTSLRDLMVNRSASLDRKAIEESVDLVFDLARMCRDFIAGDVLAGALSERRQGIAADVVVNRAVEKAADTEAAAYSRKWLVGLRQIGCGVDVYTAEWSELCDGVERPWQRIVWNVVVKESLTGLLVESVKQALSQPRLKTIPIATANRDEVDRFRYNVLLETGRRIRNKDVATVAGYKDTSELKHFQRNDKRRTKAGTENIRRVLGLQPSTFIAELDAKETRRQTRLAT